MSKTEKKRLNGLLNAAAELRISGQYAQAKAMLAELEHDPHARLLGHTTSLGLPRRLQSAFLKLAKAEKDRVSVVGYQYHSVPPPALLSAYSQLSSDERRAIVGANRQPVPRKIHQIWVGPNAPPEGAKAWARHASAQGYDYQLWRDDNLNTLGLHENPVYADMLAKGDFPGAVDVARYLILEQQGGIYLDCDWYPSRNDLSFHDFLPMTGLTTMAEDIPRNTGMGGLLLANSMIAAPPNHPVFTGLLSTLHAVMSDLPDAPAWWATGPLIFTLMARGGSVTLADADIVAGKLAQETPLSEVEKWCQQALIDDKGLLLAWKSWVWR
jgi:mannosyltransferase OCH1-like enzyme